jgi:predicted peptidase
MRRVLVCGAIVLGFCSQAVWGANVADFIDFSLRDSSDNLLLPGRLYVPPEVASDPSTPRSFILFLHGAGEDGTNNTSQINSNIDNLLAEAKLKGAYLYAPQTMSDWSSATLTNNVMTMIGRAEADMDVNATRIYITGLSNGGGGTWNMLSRYPGQFAAAIPIAGVAPASDFMPSHLLSTPIFAFHARDDSTVSVSTTRNVLNKILSADGVSLPTYPTLGSSTNFFIYNPDLVSNLAVQQAVVQFGNVNQFSISGSQLDLMYFELFAGGHAIWSNVYSGAPVYDWLFSHSLAVPEPCSAVDAAIALAMLSGFSTMFSGDIKRKYLGTK